MKTAAPSALRHSRMHRMKARATATARDARLKAVAVEVARRLNPVPVRPRIPGPMAQSAVDMWSKMLATEAKKTSFFSKMMNAGKDTHAEFIISSKPFKDQS